MDGLFTSSKPGIGAASELSAIRTLHPFWDNFRIAGNPGEAIEHSRKCKAENDQREEHRRTFFTLADILE